MRLERFNNKCLILDECFHGGKIGVTPSPNCNINDVKSTSETTRRKLHEMNIYCEPENINHRNIYWAIDIMIL